jgi:hypothetical protein
MKIEFTPTLHTQRELYAQPRDMARFQWYINQVTGGTDDVALPISMVNPMGKPHCLDAVNALMGIDAEAIVAETAQRAAAEIDADMTLRVFVNLLDDAMGGWTNRTFTEFKLRYGDPELARGNSRRHFSGVYCWTSQRYDPADIRQITRDAIWRGAQWVMCGVPRTLRDMLALDAAAARFAGPSLPALEADDAAYTREVLAPLMDATDQPTQIAALFGDAAANACGYPPLGLSDRAGQRLTEHHHESL